MRKARTFRPQILVAIFLLCFSQQSHAEEVELRLGTGAAGAVYDQLGRVIAEIVNEKASPELSIDVVTTDGSVDNLMLMRDGELDIAIVQNDIAYYVYEGSHGYDTFDGFGTGMSLFAEYIQVLVRTDSSVRALGDLAGQTVSIGSEGSGSYHNAVDLLAEAGLRPGIEFAAEYLALDQALPLLQSGSIDAIIVTGAIFPPTTALDPTGVRAVSLSREVVNALALSSPYYVPDEADVLVDGQEKNISTASVMAFLVISDRVSESHVQAIATYLEEQSGRLRTIENGQLDFASIEQTNVHRPVPLHAGVRSYFLKKGYIESGTTIYWIAAVGALLIALVVYAQVRCSAYDRLGNVRSASGDWTYKVMLTFSRFNTLIIVSVVFVLLIFSLVESIQFFETEYARQNNIRNQFADIGFWDAVLWMFMFMGSGHTDDIFPLSVPGRVLATTLPFLGIGGVLGFGLLGLDETRARVAAKQRGRLPTKVKNHVLVCGWNDKAIGIVYGLTSDDVPRKKQVVVVADIDNDMPLENHDFDPRFVSYQRGDSADHSVLARANIQYADAAVVVAGVKKRAGRNVRSILSVMALKESFAKANAHRGTDIDGLFVAAELIYDENRALFHACGADAVITADLVANRMAAQCCVNLHIVDFVLDALTYDNASELYSTRVKRVGCSSRGWHSWKRKFGLLRTGGDEISPLIGKTLPQVRSNLAKSGVNVIAAARSRNHGEVLIDDVFDDGQYIFPHDTESTNEALTDGHVLLFFANDHSDIHDAARQFERHQASDLGMDPPDKVSRAFEPIPRKILLVGDWERCSVVKEMLVSIPWCTTTILTETVPNHSDVPNGCVVGDLSNEEVWHRAGIDEVDQITILAQSGETTKAGQVRDEHGEVDARAIFAARFARNFCLSAGRGVGQAQPMPLIAAEMLGHRSRPLFADAGIDVIIPSSLLVERMLTKLVYSKGSVCRFLMALLAFDDNRHIMTINLSATKHQDFLNKSFEQLMSLLPVDTQLLGVLPADPAWREKLRNTVADFDYHILTAPFDSDELQYRSREGDELLVIVDRRKN